MGINAEDLDLRPPGAPQQMELGVKDGEVWISFAEPVPGFIMPASQARKLGRMFIEMADRAEKESGHG
jgi:hypothetical protein